MSRSLYDQILLFGDSITQQSFDPTRFSYGSALANEYQRKLDVVARGLSGYNTKWALPILEQILPRKDIDPILPKILLFVIFFGANDSCLPHSPQHVPIEQFQENLKKMINFVKQPESFYYAPHTRVILITPPPTDPERWATTRAIPLPKPNRDIEVTKSYAKAVISLGEELDIPVIDIWTGIMDKVNREVDSVKELPNPLEKLTTCQRLRLENYLTDGLHLDGPGYQVLFDLLMPILKSKYPELDPETMPMTLPWWGDLDLNNLSESLRVDRLHG